jgi:hypothetical protein
MCDENKQCQYCYDDDLRDMRIIMDKSKASKIDEKHFSETSSSDSSDDGPCASESNSVLVEEAPHLESNILADKVPHLDISSVSECVGQDLPLKISERVTRLYNSDTWTCMIEFEAEIKAILKLVFSPVLGSGRRVRPWPFPGLWVLPLDVSTGYPYVCLQSCL